MTTKLIVNDDLRNLLPPLSDEEQRGLEESILKDGCLTPLILWNDILIDGHFRYAICTKHQIPFLTQNVEIASLDDAKLWIWHHQQHRRNLTPYQRAEIALKFKPMFVAKAKENQGLGGGRGCPSRVIEKQIDTKKELASIAQMSTDTISKAEYIVENADETTKKHLRQGEKGVSINSVYNRLRDKYGHMPTEPRSSGLESKRPRKIRIQLGNETKLISVDEAIMLVRDIFSCIFTTPGYSNLASKVAKEMASIYVI